MQYNAIAVFYLRPTKHIIRTFYVSYSLNVSAYRNFCRLISNRTRNEHSHTERNKMKLNFCSHLISLMGTFRAAEGEAEVVWRVKMPMLPLLQLLCALHIFRLLWLLCFSQTLFFLKEDLPILFFDFLSSQLHVYRPKCIINHYIVLHICVSSMLFFVYLRLCPLLYVSCCVSFFPDSLNYAHISLFKWLFNKILCKLFSDSGGTVLAKNRTAPKELEFLIGNCISCWENVASHIQYCVWLCACTWANLFTEVHIFLRVCIIWMVCPKYADIFINDCIEIAAVDVV